MKTIIGNTIQLDKPFTGDELVENDTCYINCKFILSINCRTAIEFNSGIIVDIDKYFTGCVFIGDKFTYLKINDSKLALNMGYRGVSPLFQNILNNIDYIKRIYSYYE